MSKPIELDEKRRGTFGPDFSPGDSFTREVIGDCVIFRKRTEPKTLPVRKSKKGAFTVGEIIGPVDEAAVSRAIEQFP